MARKICHPTYLYAAASNRSTFSCVAVISAEMVSVFSLNNPLSLMLMEKKKN